MQLTIALISVVALLPFVTAQSESVGSLESSVAAV